jgi:hypothetical protein
MGVPLRVLWTDRDSLYNLTRSTHPVLRVIFIFNDPTRALQNNLYIVKQNKDE